MKIKNKLLLSYLVILIVSFTLVSISFQYIFRFYTLSQTRTEVKKEAELLTQTLAADLDNEKIGHKVQAIKNIKLAGRLLDAYVIVLDKSDKPVYSNADPAQRQEILRSLRNKSLVSNPYLVERVAVNSNNPLVGSVIVAAQSQDVNTLLPSMLKSEMLSFLAAGIVAFAIATWFSRHLTRPIGRLRQGMHAFSLRKPYEKLSLKTGDEIEDLSHCFDELAIRLKNFDEGQKDFIQNTSHELKTPLMSIQGYAEAIRDGLVEGEELDNCLDVIIEESQRLKRTVEQLIYLSRLESPGDQFNYQVFPAGALFDELRNRLQAPASLEGIELDFQGDASLQLYLDREKIYQALYNIIDNCLRFASRRVSTIIYAESEWVFIIIGDDGPGINPEVAKKVFDRYFKGPGGQSGIGLAISRAVVEGHKGSILARNGANGGAEFVISLPMSTK